MAGETAADAANIPRSLSHISTASPVLAAPACAPPFSSRENRLMSDWVILATALASFDHAATAHKVLAPAIISPEPEMFRGARPNIINLSRSYSYQSRGYYASLLAAARGQRVIPSVETIIDLSARKLYENAIPELEDALNKAISDRPDEAAPANGSGCFSEPAPIRASSDFCRLLFDWFRAPALEVTIKPGSMVTRSRACCFCPFGKLDGADRRFSTRPWRATRRGSGRMPSPALRPAIQLCHAGRSLRGIAAILH
jgi:hypothetical protein